MPKNKTWNTYLIAKQNNFGCSAAIASNDPVTYPAGGAGVELSTYQSDTGDLRDVASALLDSFVKRAVDEDVAAILVMSNVPLYGNPAHMEEIMGCAVHFVCMDGDAFDCPADPVVIRRGMAEKAADEGLAKLEADAGRIVFDLPPLVPGQYVLYKNGDRYQLGRVKRVADDGGAFVWYSAGETASKTPRDCLYLLENARNITGTDLGGADARAMFPAEKGE